MMPNALALRAMSFFMRRAKEALDGTDPTAVATIGEFFLQEAMTKPVPKEFAERWSFILNNDSGELRLPENVERMYYEAVGAALRVTHERIKQLYKEARPTWTDQPSS